MGQHVVRHPRILILLWLSFLSTGCDSSKTDPPTAEEVLRRRAKIADREDFPTGDRAMKLLELGAYEEAWAVAQQVLVRDRSDSKAIFVAARVLHGKGKIRDAIQLLDEIASDHSQTHLLASGQAASWALELGELRDAERRFKALYDEYPNDSSVQQQLSQIYEIQGRRWESGSCLQRLLHANKESDRQLMMLVDLSEPIDATEEVERFLRLRPSDPLPKLGRGFRELHLGNASEAESLFREVWAFGNAPTACWIGLGLALIAQQNFQELKEWLRSIPDDAMTFPEYWIIVGEIEWSESRLETSCRAFVEAVALDDSRSRSLHRLGQTLAQLGFAEEAAIILERASHVEKLSRALQRVSFGNQSSEARNEVAIELQWLGRVDEANRWLQRIGRTGISSSSDSRTRLHQLLAKLRAGFALPELQSPPSPSSESLPLASYGMTPIRFQERRDLFLEPVFFNGGNDLDKPGMTIYQSNGGGVGVLDFDLDGWPDLYVVQGGADPRTPNSCGAGQLLHNHSATQFVDVARAAHAQNFAFGCSIGVGDWNQDGFPDLFLANFGVNKLLENCGDGTFQEIPLPYKQQGLHWTSCATVADISGDGLPDLIEINYADAEAAYQRICSGANHTPRVCRPTEFAIEQNRVWINQGDGTFRLGTAEFPWEDGRGLGVIVTNLDRQFGNDVYIANDWSANNYLVSRPDPNQPGRYLLRDEAALRGCAVDNEGKPQAGMGIACGDVNRDGQIDLFITNFYDEYNTLYLHKHGGVFDIASRRYRLIEPSRNMLGFGTQFGDFNHDGWLDCVILNGHVDDFRSEGMAFRMLPQILVHRGDRFELQVASLGGTYFERPNLGRGLATWDFNRDGLLDLVATHLDLPLTILQNVSAIDPHRDGHWIELELVGTHADRDAIGTFVELQCGNENWTATVAAGNGFACANERVIHLGLGQHTVIDELRVTWPDGSVESHFSVVPDRRHRILQSIGLANP